MLNKFILIFCTFFTAISSYSFDVQFGAGGLTPHFGTSKKNYCNQWNNTGIIANKSYYIRLLGEKFGFTYLKGHDSICSDIDGVFINYSLSKGEYVDLGILAGGYSYNPENWKEHARKSPSGIESPEPVHTVIGDRDVVPVLALTVGIDLIRSTNWSLVLNNIFTPIIFNHSLAVEIRF